MAQAEGVRTGQTEKRKDTKSRTALVRGARHRKKGNQT